MATPIRLIAKPVYQRQDPSRGAAVGVVVDVTEWGWGFAIGGVPAFPAFLESPALLVAGFNSFNLILTSLVALGGTANLRVFVQHCDPTTGTPLGTQLEVGLAPAGATTTVQWGAFGVVVVTNTGPHAWHTIKIFLSGDGASGTLDGPPGDPMLLCGTR